jgi:predicted AAA+ superfamily ATPase
LVLEVARQMPAIYLDMENNLDLLKVADIHAFYNENKGQLVILDEVQHLPQLFKSIRGTIEEER